MWQCRMDDTDLVITGPGSLELILHDFDRSRVEHHEDLGAEVLGTLIQRSWRYPIEPGIWLELISTEDTGNLDSPALHMLHAGTAISWHLPDAFAEDLHGMMKGAS